jgi:hypothetical protein
MKIKTNLRAGKQGRSGGVDDTPHPEDVKVVPVPVSRCVGI